MNNGEQRIALSEWLGWSKCRMAILGAGAPERRASPYGFPPGKTCEARLPDYPNDLNAIHKAESKMSIDQWRLYTLILNETVSRSVNLSIQANLCIHATAAQRSESILKTLGKWKAKTKP